MTRNHLQKYLTAGVYREVDGEAVELNTFIADFHAWLKAKQHDPADWHPQRVREEISRDYLVGRGAGNKMMIGNISRERIRPKRYVLAAKGVLRLEQPANT